MLDEGVAMDGKTVILPGLLELTTQALPPLEEVLVAAREALRDKVSVDGKVSGKALEAEQFAAHAFSWLSLIHI